MCQLKNSLVFVLTCLLAIVGLLLVDAGNIDRQITQGATYENGVKVFRQGKYSFVHEYVNFTEASSRCKSYGYGSLLSIESSYENGQIADLLTMSGSFENTMSSGYFDSEANTWMWESLNEPMNFTAWFQSEPVPRNGVMVVTGYWNAYGWTHISDSETARFICESDQP